MGRRKVEMVKIGPSGMLVAAFLVAVLALVFLLTVPAKAQDTSRATDAAGETARITESTADDDEIVDRIVVAAGDCRVGSDASVVVEDDDGTQARLTDGGNVRITADADAITIVGTGDGGNIRGIDASGGDRQFGTEGETVEGQVVSSTNVRCGRDDTGDDNATDDDNGNGAEIDDLENLDCDELLVLFRGEGQGQYGNDGTAVDLNDSQVRAQIEVCLEREIVNEPGGKLPKTGGLSLIGVAVLGAATAVAGLSVIRGGRR
jgi:hypothetical protein